MKFFNSMAKEILFREPDGRRERQEKTNLPTTCEVEIKKLESLGIDVCQVHLNEEVGQSLLVSAEIPRAGVHIRRGNAFSIFNH